MRKIYAIPGLGTTKELFRELKINGVELVVLDWPLPTGNETLKSYSERFIEKIDTSEPFYLVGVSFGGMICTELNEILKPERTFLISSIKNRKELPLLFRALKYFPLHKLVGERMFRKINARSEKIIGIERRDLPEFIEMMNQMPDNYYTNCITYILKWERTRSEKTVIHLHGSMDKLLPCKFLKANFIIDKGTHAMIFYNAREINSIINANL